MDAIVKCLDKLEFITKAILDRDNVNRVKENISMPLLKNGRLSFIISACIYLLKVCVIVISYR